MACAVCAVLITCVKKDEFRGKTRAGILGWSVEYKASYRSGDSTFLFTAGKAAEGEHDAAKNI